jgi:hypothetical protein
MLTGSGFRKELIDGPTPHGELLRLLHNEDPAQRPSLDQILNHGFMTEVDPIN